MADPVTGPLAHQFAQVREALPKFAPRERADELVAAHAALSVIERHLQKVEAMIRDHHRGLAAIGGGPCVCEICAALSVGEERSEARG